ncbi:MAG TPA: xanthine dehydrogenase family protein molybdopterin-binding subunit [Burkholderiaceae bacterium]|nr:xanthine dehydrogenase family protein molybdopterin-binding subunit [Burkholderiaceae bacterium]
MATMKFGIGQAITRREDDRLLTGQGRFVDDIRLPNALHAMFVRSPHAHARVGAIDIAEARAVEGVVAILTGSDLQADGVAPFPPNPMLKPDAGGSAAAVPLAALAADVVRFVGQPVAVVLAESRAAAERAANLVQVDYGVLPAVASLDAALAPSAPTVWPGTKSNVAGQAAYGDRAACDQAFAAAKHVARITVDNQRLAPVTLEPRGCVAEFDRTSGRLTFHATSQNPAGYQGTLAKLLGLAPEQVRVVVGDVGGGFGMKALVHPEDVVCAHAARRIGRPVRWRATRLEEFQASSHGRDQRAEAELALDGEGRILGLRVRITGAIGAYGHGAGTFIHLAIGPKVTTGVYNVPVLDLQSKVVLTNTNLIGAYRGAGRPEAVYLIERLMDRAAADMKIDPAELRRRNLVQPGQMPYRNAMGETFDSGNFPKMLEQALAAADWAGYDARRRASEAQGKRRGRAVSTFLEWTGVVHEETVRLHVEGDGRVRVFTAMQAMGQGIETSYVQILAETLQVDPDRIEIVQGDSDVAQGIGSMGSRSLYIGGSAMQTASTDAIDKGRDLASKALEAPASDLVYAEGRYKVVGTDLGIDLAALAQQQPEHRIAVTTVQKVGGASWPNGCHVCEVEIEPETGRVEIVRYTTYDDVGRVVNPMIVAGQVHGGIAQAVGQALHERVVYDAEGQLLTGSFMDYGIPRADDLPDFATHTDESEPCRINPLGAKGVGELGTVGATPTVINAVVDALRPLGVSDIAMPATPERVWRAIRDARG